MRISKGGLLVVLAFIAPVIVELRTVLAWFGVELSVLESVVLSVVVVVAILIWAFLPDDEGENGDDGSRRSPVSNGD